MQIIIKLPKPRSVAAQALANRLYHRRVVASKKAYSRKGKSAKALTHE